LDKMPSYRGALQRSLFFHEKERLQSFLDQHVKGKKVQYPAYTSMSAGSEAYNPHGQVQLFVLESRRGKDIRQFNDDEHEVLYPRGSRFRVNMVKMVKPVGKQYHIFLEEDEND